MTSGDVTLLAVRMVVSLAVVLGLLVLLARVAARRGLGGPASTRVRLDVLARRSVGRSASVQVVRVAGRTLLLGVAEGGVRVLTELEAADLEEEAVARAAAEAVSGPDAGVGEGGSRDARPVEAESSPTWKDELAKKLGRQQEAAGSVVRQIESRREGRHRARRGTRGRE